MIKNTGGINDLPSRVLVVSVSYEQTLSGESIRLHVDISISHIVNETGLSDVWITCNKQCSGIGINAWESSKMLPYFLEIAK